MWMLLIGVAIVAFCFPKGFTYLVLVPFLGTCIGGFAWSVLGLLGLMPWGFPGFGASLLGGIALAALMARDGGAP